MTMGEAVDAGQPEQQMTPDEMEELRQLDKDIRRMFYLQDDQSLQDITWPQIIDKFRDLLNKYKVEIGNVYTRGVQDAPHMAERDVDMDDDIKEMLVRVEDIINYSLEHKTPLGPMTDIQIILQRMQRFLQVYAQWSETWLRLFHVMVEKTKEDPEQEGPSVEEEIQEQLKELEKTQKEATEAMQRTADDYKKDAEAVTSKLETKLRRIEEDFAKHKACKFQYCHKGKTNNKPKEEEPPEAPKKGKSKKR